MKGIADLVFSRNADRQRPEGSEPSPCVFSGLMCSENYRRDGKEAEKKKTKKPRRLRPPGGRSCLIGQGGSGRGAVEFRMHGEGRDDHVCGCAACGWERTQSTFRSKPLKQLCCH